VIRTGTEGTPEQPNDRTTERLVVEALCRSGLYEALALGFRPPTEETVARLASPEGAGALADAAAVLDAEWQSDLAPLVRRLAASPGPTSLESLEASYRRLFGHTARGKVPAYETEYGEDSLFLPAQEMSDLGAFVGAFGLALRPTAHERIDHIACECEFMLFLARKEAYAVERGDHRVAEEVRCAARLFLRDHLGRFGPAFGKKLARADPDGFYGSLGELCAAFVAQECRRVDVPVGSEVLRLRSAVDPEVPMACGTGTELLQIQGLASAKSE
jgi:TorA maturation chaperone TorD